MRQNAPDWRTDSLGSFAEGKSIAGQSDIIIRPVYFDADFLWDCAEPDVNPVKSTY